MIFIFLIFPKFLNFFPKIATGGLFEYYDIVSKVKKDLVHSKSECVIFFIKNLLNNFIDQDSSKFTGGHDSIEYGKAFKKNFLYNFWRTSDLTIKHF